MWKNRYDVIIVSTTKADVAKKAHKLLAKNKSIEEIKSALNTKDIINVMATTGTFEEGSDALPKTIPLKKGLSEFKQEGNYFYIVKVNDIKEAGPKTLEECKGRVVNDYQQYLEENWVSNLKSEFTVKTNPDVFAAVKKQIKQ
jgi:peptidyl-prolyl cis-trans isomerase SurA